MGDEHSFDNMTPISDMICRTAVLLVSSSMIKVYIVNLFAFRFTFDLVSYLIPKQLIQM